MITPLIIAIATFISTLLGGLFALRFKDRLHLILGFSAGAVIGVAFFDLIPEAIELGGDTYGISTITSIIAGGFVIYLILDRLFTLHGHADMDCSETERCLSRRGILGAGSLVFHSFLDGIAVGLAFQVSAAVGAIVAIAVLVHDFSDGINTVNLILKNKGHKDQAFHWLLASAAAPVIGVVSTFFFTLSESMLGIILAIFAGFFMYIGASDLLPESHHTHSAKWTTIITVVGVVVLYAAIQLAHM